MAANEREATIKTKTKCTTNTEQHSMRLTASLVSTKVKSKTRKWLIDLRIAVNCSELINEMKYKGHSQ